MLNELSGNNNKWVFCWTLVALLRFIEVFGVLLLFWHDSVNDTLPSFTLFQWSLKSLHAFLLTTGASSPAFSLIQFGKHFERHLL